MYGRIIKNDIKKSKLITITITAFILVAALLTSLAAILIINLSTAIDHMLLEAQTPHFLQMHSGEINLMRLQNFADQQTVVEDFQIAGFLNIDGSDIKIGAHSLADSVQDNGLAVQNDKFDYLLDLNGDRIFPADGEIYVPIYYMKEGIVKVGDQVIIHGTVFTVAGFVRDSQMNSALISSKRFLVSKNDFHAMLGFGSLESLIEFRLKEGASLSEFEAAYIDAGLEKNGPPAITHSLFKLANAISDGMLIAVLILISLLVILVTFLCIRFTLLAKVEEDYKEIGVLKAIGIRISNIKKIYLAKYGAIAAIACILGFLLSLLLQDPLMENIRLYMGESDGFFLSVLFGILGAALIFFIILFYVHCVLGRFRKLSAMQAIRSGAPQEKSKTAKRFLLSKARFFSPNLFLGIKDVLSRKKLYVTMLLVLVIASFIMIVPQNIYNTISSRNFITYMGIGNCDMRLDLQQVEDLSQRAEEILSRVKQDASISKSVLLTSMMFDMPSENGTTQRLKVELGDHSVFPIEYSSGRAPQTVSEIALSAMNADEFEKAVGSQIVLVVDGAEKQFTICGIYSDITNGGKTAKAVFETRQTEILWSILAVTFYDNTMTEAKVSEYKEAYSYAKVSDIDSHIEQTFGTTIASMEKVSYAAVAVTIVLTVLVTLLFMKMMVVKDRYSISVLKSLGFTSSDIRRQYVTRSVIVLVLGVLIGIVLSNTLGEVVGGALISSFGASSFHFEVNPWFAYALAPIVIAACVSIATLFGIRDIGALKASEYIKE